MIVKEWTLLAFTCLLIAICLADTSASRLEVMKSQELEEPHEIDVKKGEESEGLETRYDQLGRGMKISHKESQAPKEGPKNGDMKKPVRKEGKSWKGAGISPSDPASPKPKNPEPVPKSNSDDGKKGNTSINGGPRTSKIEEKPEANEKKKPGTKDGEGSEGSVSSPSNPGTPKDTTIGPNPKVKSVGEKGIKSSEPNKIQYGKLGETTGMDKKKSTISTDGKGTPKSRATTPMPKSKNERKTGKTSPTPNKNPHGGSRDSKIGDKEDEQKNDSRKNGEGSNHETATRKPPMPFKVGREGGPLSLGPGTRKTSVPDEPSISAPDTSFASGNLRSSSESSPSTATTAPKKGKKGKNVQEWWSVEDLIYDLLTHLIGWSLCAVIYWKWYQIPSLIDGYLRLLKLKTHVKKINAENNSDNRTAKFRKMGPIYIPSEPPIPPAADLPDNIVLEKDEENNEFWFIESDLSDTEDEDDGGSKKSKKSKKVGSKEKKKIGRNDDTNTAKELGAPAPLPSPAAPTASAPSHPTDSTPTNPAHTTAPSTTNPAESAALAPMVPLSSSNAPSSTAIPTLLPATTGTPN